MALLKSFASAVVATAFAITIWLPLEALSAEAKGLPPQPVVAAAVQVAHATQSTMLAATRAGDRVVAVGDHGIILLSDDGGKTHRQAKSVPVDATLTAVSFVDAKHGWAAGHWGVVLHTEDGGETWSQQRLATNEDRPLFAIHFFDAKAGVAAGLWSLVLVTDDGGKTWHKVELPIPEGARKADLNLFSLFADAKGRLFAAGEKGMVLRSDDRGRHWTYLATGYKGSFWTGLVTAEGSILVGGLRGSLYRSNDQRKWTRVDTGTKASITALAQAGPEIVGVGLDGLVLNSQDGGATFSSEVRPDRESLTALAINGSGRPILYSSRGVVGTGSGAK